MSILIRTTDSEGQISLLYSRMASFCLASENSGRLSIVNPDKYHEKVIPVRFSRSGSGYMACFNGSGEEVIRNGSTYKAGGASLQCYVTSSTTEMVRQFPFAKVNEDLSPILKITTSELSFEIPLPKDEKVRVGSSCDDHIQINTKNIRINHFEITATDSCLILLPRTGPVSYNGNRLSREFKMEVGDAVQAADVTFTLASFVRKR